MGVNDLAEDWLSGSTVEEALFLSGDPHCEAYGSAANDLQELARTAWHPISCRDDAKGCPVDMVMVRKIDGTIHQAWGPNLQSDWDVYTHWARIEDVVLLPQSNEK